MELNHRVVMPGTVFEAASPPWALPSLCGGCGAGCRTRTRAASLRERCSTCCANPALLKVCAPDGN